MARPSADEYPHASQQCTLSFRPRLIRLALAAFLLSGAIQPAAVLAAPPTVTLGVAAATSGPAAGLGWTQLNAVTLAVDQVNNAGGVLVGGQQHQVLVVAADDACDAGQGAAAANALVAAGAVAVIGHTCSGGSAAAQPIYQAAGVSMLSPSSTAIALTETGSDVTFRVTYRDDAVTNLLADYAYRWLGIGRVAVVQLDDGWTQSHAITFSSRFTSLGGTVTGVHQVSSAAEFAAALITAAAGDPEAVFFADFDAARAGAFSAAAETAGIHTVLWDSMESDRGPYAAGAGLAAAGDYAGTYGRTAAEMPGYAAFEADYLAAGFAQAGSNPGFIGALAYDAARIAMAAIQEAGSADGGAVRAAIAATGRHVGVVGTYRGFDAKGDALPQWVSLWTYRQGDWREVVPSLVYLPLALVQAE